MLLSSHPSPAGPARRIRQAVGVIGTAGAAALLHPSASQPTATASTGATVEAPRSAWGTTFWPVPYGRLTAAVTDEKVMLTFTKTSGPAMQVTMGYSDSTGTHGMPPFTAGSGSYSWSWNRSWAGGCVRVHLVLPGERVEREGCP
ncbi:hypothetical protein ACFVH6_37535 [Spirillospora sp. NPDC127200]